MYHFRPIGGEFVQELKEKYPDIANVIRLKNKAQEPLKAPNESLDAGVVSILHMKLKVVEYDTQTNVLIYSHCYGVGHFRKSCPQKNGATCKVCGEKSSNLKEHQYSSTLKCIQCGGGSRLERI